LKKIFLENKTILTGPASDFEEAGLSGGFSPSDEASLWNGINAFLKSDEKKLFIYSNEEAKVIGRLGKLWGFIRAGGGVVKNENDEWLLILRKGLWDLPKGKLDPGESPEKGALREVEEECGLSGLTITGAAVHGYHFYRERKKPLLKETWWFPMEVAGSPALYPQKEEAIEKAIWANHERAIQLLEGSYPNIKDMLNRMYPELFSFKID
jgi:8-oxo-dGTP pyrophosphatase MutT (NUDIX family)